jgi:predicted phage tail protein
MRTIHLYGHLAETFGASFRLEVFSAAEAVRALEANFPGRFYRALARGEYHVVKGDNIESGESFGEDLLTFGLGAKDLHLMPAMAGAKDGIWTVVIGVALIGAAVFTAGAAAGLAGISMGAAMGEATFLGISMASYATFGISLALSGISTMLSPTMDLPSTGTRAAVDPRASFVIQGAENVAAQGVPVPLVCGKFLVGSVVISQSVLVEDVL